MISSNSTRSKGTASEKLAVKFLKKRKYRIVESNYSCRFGEIDIIAFHGDTLVFVEVKSRANDDYGPPSEAVNYHKQRRIAMTAGHYVSRHHIHDVAMRFDVVSIIGSGKTARIELIESAFESPF